MIIWAPAPNKRTFIGVVSLLQHWNYTGIIPVGSGPPHGDIIFTAKFRNASINLSAGVVCFAYQDWYLQSRIMLEQLFLKDVYSDHQIAAQEMREL